MPVLQILVGLLCGILSKHFHLHCRRSSQHEPAVLRSQGITDEESLAHLLYASTAQGVAAAFARLGCNHAAAVLEVLAGREKGAAAVAALLQCLSPVVAVR